MSVCVGVEAVGSEELGDHGEEDRLQFELCVVALAEIVEVKTHHLCTVGLVTVVEVGVW